MKVSVCVTTLNEDRSISPLLDSLLEQTKKPSEIIIVDAGSKDQTVQIIRHYQKKDSRIKLVIENGASRAKGRNIAVDLAENNIIAMTDAGCIAEPKWLERISQPFGYGDADIVAGFYKMTGSQPLQKALSVFLGVMPSKFKSDFLPSTRSIAFKKSAWESVGGFFESLKDTAEDTRFNYDAVRQGLKFARVKNARMEWGMPAKFKEGFKKMYEYSLGDMRSGIWIHPTLGLSSHNVKSFLKLVRYFAGLALLIFGFTNPLLILILLLLLIFYCFWSFYKVFSQTKSFKAGLWGVVLQFASDYATFKALYSVVTNS